MIGKIKSSLALKVSLIMFLLLLLVAFVVGSLGLFFYQRDEFAINASLAQVIASTTAAAIDGDQYEELTQTYEANGYWDELKAQFDEAKTQTDALYLYGMNNGSTDELRYVVDGMKPSDDPDLIGALGDTETADAFAEEMFTTLQTAQPMPSGSYDGGEYGTMVSGYAPILNSAGQVVGVVGADISLETVMANIRAFAFQLLGAALLVSLLFGAIVIWYINKKVGVPVKQLAGAAGQIAVGDMNIRVSSQSQDEIGQLTNAFQEMMENTQQQVDVLTDIANSDYTKQIEPRSEHDQLNLAVKQILQNNISLISGIRDASEQVAGGAEQVANTAQSLATGATQQAATLEEFSASIADVHGQAEENTLITNETLEQVTKAGSLMAQSTEQMTQMTHAMDSIKKSSEDIAQIIKVIDDIAFQTNILALNAAVEAARAGQHGKGFAVVADEVRNLASKSAAAAKETATMIENSVENVRLGGNIVQQTEAGLTEVAQIANSSAQSMEKVSELSQRQSLAIQEINQGVEQISAVVQSNSATAEESAASAEEMSAQASLLERMVTRFALPPASSAGSPRQLPPGEGPPL